MSSKSPKVCYLICFHFSFTLIYWYPSGILLHVVLFVNVKHGCLYNYRRSRTSRMQHQKESQEAANTMDTVSTTMNILNTMSLVVHLEQLLSQYSFH